MGFNRLTRTPEFVDELSRSVRAILLRRFPGLPAQDLEDIEQEVKLKIWKMAAGGKNIRYFRSYLWKTVYTTALDVLDSRLDRLLEEERFAPEGLDSSAERWDRVLALRKAIKELPPGRRQVVDLHLDGLGLEESAKRLGWSANRVRHLFYRARVALRRKLSGAGPSAASLPVESEEE
jgi:RNA polymerase sigma factor (sigma-70 family)